MLDQMYGISKSASKKYDRLIDGYSRQLAYHGLHEVGQMMVDQTGDDVGCTVVAAPAGRHWVLGRNFDFEGGRSLDTEKIMKWVFPDHGAAYVSVNWAGMVGTVTGVNEHGIYLSLNAAGSSDHRRYGLPTTLLLTKALMFSRDAEDALEIFKSEPVIITDIFVLLDSRTGRLYRIEKSPLKTEVIELEGPSAITNHLVSEAFATDPINVFRRDELTSGARMERARELLKAPEIANAKSTGALELPILKIIRDKGGYYPGHRRAIDSLIAVHSVLYNSESQTLYVSRGPALAGPFAGFDLPASFAAHQPIVTKTLPRDEISDDLFWSVHNSSKSLRTARKLIQKKRCSQAKSRLDGVSFRESAEYFEALGDFKAECESLGQEAVQNWRRALALRPAYSREQTAIQNRLEKWKGRL